MLEKKFMSKITIYILVFNFQCILLYKNNGTKGTTFKRNLWNKYATWYYSYRCTNPITLISTSGNHYEYFTINNLLKSMELKYYFLRKYVNKTTCVSS